MSLPSISVIVPAFNSARTIEPALRSALEQTHPPLEVIVVDDGSDDDTAERARAFGPPVRVLTQANGGTAAARSAGLRHAGGDVVAFLDADDTYEPTHLAELAEPLAVDGGLAAVVTDALLVAPDRSFRCGAFWPAHAARPYIDISAPIIFCAFGIRRRVLDELGPFDSSFVILEDVEMWHRLLCRGHRVLYVDSPSYVYRIAPESKSQSGLKRRGETELLRINARYAFARTTPHRWRVRLAVRALRKARVAAFAAVAGR